MNCKQCKYYTETYKYKGICRLFDEYVKEDSGCDNFEEE